jgi:hypothetical protein
MERRGGVVGNTTKRILSHLDSEGDGTPEISPEVENPLEILCKVGGTKRVCGYRDFFGKKNPAYKVEEHLLEGFPNGEGAISDYLWVHTESTGHWLEDPRTLSGHSGKTYILAQLKNGNFIYLIASMSGVLAEYYGTEEGDWQFGYLFVSKSREELIEKCMTDEEYTRYIKTSSGYIKTTPGMDIRHLFSTKAKPATTKA